ncbi:MAG: hypothetical protein D3X82_13805 [Candidatus Leucobacter sulfamidivorax]|nr:hypothetical protein [Candidatus Leucobacter sulfamidivorax]
MMFELPEPSSEIRLIDFGSNGKVLFQLPVLGDPGVPMLLNTSVALMMEAFKQGRPTDAKIASIWAMFIDAIGNSYPNALQHLGGMDLDQLKHVVTHWFTESQKLTGYSPKAP